MKRREGGTESEWKREKGRGQDRVERTDKRKALKKAQNSYENVEHGREMLRKGKKEEERER